MEAGFELIRTKEPDDLVTFMRNDEYIDIGIFREVKKGPVDYYTYQGRLIGKKFLNKLEDIMFLGQKFNIPNNKEEYLKKTYGSDWMIPRKNEPALNTGMDNAYFRFKRSFLRTGLGRKIKSVIKKALGRA